MTTSAHAISRRQWGALLLLGLVYTLHTVDRNIVSALVEPIKREFQVSDRAMGALSGLAHALAFSAAVLPMGWCVDRFKRTRLLTAILAIWSLLTAASAFATGYWSLLLARVGVGAAESGSSPACMSLISDIFPPSRRASAIGLFYLSTAIGTGLVFLVGAAVAHDHGWRLMFVLAGVPGLALALWLPFALKEPLRGQFDDRRTAEVSPGVRDVLAFVGSSASVLLLTLAIMTAAMLMSSLWSWSASFLIRLHGLSLKEAGLAVAIVAGVAQAIGSAVSGPVADRIARGRPGRLVIVPVVMMGCAVLSGYVMVLAPTLPLSIGGAVAMGLMIGGWLGPGYGLLLTLTPAPMRGRVMAGSQLFTNLIGVGLGPLLTGALSDAFGGADSLRWAIAVTLVLGLVSAALFSAAGRVAGTDEKNGTPVWRRMRPPERLDASAAGKRS